ncbi:hypothetical protein CBR_g19069 [Chara braunii]|uniref:Uncharacterized protein n=1 Tax=Chara braunii TaxID=69332 RepID=A0A388KX93_CHABU|nr:hypothetical protein CBR_g19069 [Chara braunii]|eukprot:GBG74661.1 hypothetical protein CBR_g19069 [Chara braunii]
MGAVRESSGGEQTPSEKKSEWQRMVREEVAEGTLLMKRMRGKPEAVMGRDGGGDGERASGKRPTKEEGGTTSKKARRPGGLTIREGQAGGGGDSADPGAMAAREPSGKSKRKVAAEEGNGEKKTQRQKTAEAASGGKGPVGKEYDEAATFWLEYERNDVGEIVEKELPSNCSSTPGRVHKDVFKPEDKDKYYYYPVNGQHTVAAVKELEGEPIFNLWKMHSWPARVVWFSDRDFAGYRQVSLNENTRHKMSKQRSLKAAFLEMREEWENEGRPVAIQGNPSGKEAEKQKFFDFQKLILGKSLNGAHWTLAQKDSSLADKEYVAAVGNALRQWMPLVTAGDDVFRKAMEFYAKWAEGKLFGGDGKTPLLRPGKYMPDKSSGLQEIPEMGSKGAAGETKMGWLVRVPPPPTKKKTQADDKFFVVVKEPDMFCWQYLVDRTDAEKLSILDDILTLRGVTDVWDFLFGLGPPGPTDLEYSRRRNLVFAVLNGYHGAPRESVSHFLRRLEHIYFTLAEPLTLENYKSQFDEEDPFDAEDMEELSDSETFDFESMPLPRVVGQARTALVEHLSLMNPERNDQDVDAYAEQKLHELYANNMLEFRAPFYALETVPSRGIDWRIPQPPPAGQHPGGGGGGDEGDGGGGGGDGSQFAEKGTGETSSVEKASSGKGSVGKGSGGKGSGGKGSGGKRRTSGNFDMRDEATLASNQVRVDSHLYARSLFPVAQESSSRHAQQRSPVLNTLLLKEGASSFCLEGGMPALRWSEGATSGSLCSGDRHKLRIHSDLLSSPYAISAPHATVPRGQENVTSRPPHLQLDTGLPCSPPFSCVETRDWRSRDVLEGPAPGVLETGGSENERHTLGEDERSPGTRVVHREEETQRWQSRKVLETGGGECERHALEGVPVDTDSESAGAPGETHAVQRGEETRHGPAREDVKWLHTRALVIGMSEEVLHSRSVVATTREGVVKEGKWTSVQAPVLGDDEDEEEPAVEARVHGDEKGEEPVVEGDEVTVDIRTDPQRKDGDSSPTRCGEEQGGRVSVLSTARGMVLHEAIELGHLGDDSAATELVSD